MTTPTHAHAPMTQPPATEQPPPHSQPATAAAEPTPVPADGLQTAGAAATTRGAAGGRPWVANALVAALTAAVTVVGGILGALLVHEFNSIDDRFAAVDARFVRLEAKMDTGFAEVDAMFAAQDDKIDEINLKLTALIAALNKTDEVDAALTGRVLDPAADPEGPGGDEP